MIGEYPSLPAASIAQAGAEVAPASDLWNEFLAEFGRYGTYEAAGEGFEFRQRGEQSARVFAISPRRLRDAFVRDLAYYRLRGANMEPVLHLPQWFLDGVVEFVGSHEEPYDHRYVILVGCSLQPSADGVQPLSGPAVVMPNPRIDTPPA